MEILAAFCIIIIFLNTQYTLSDINNNEFVIYDHPHGSHYVLASKYQINPLSEIKDKNIVKQEYDFSCGSAAISTLLNYYMGENLSEQQVIQGLMEYGDVNLIQQRRAFSLLDMKRFVEVLGYKGAGYKAEIEDLRKLDKPAIIPILFYGYKHFVVFRGIYNDHVFVADPTMGNMSYTMAMFKEVWDQNYIFIISEENVKFNALALKNEDLRIINYPLEKTAEMKSIPPEFVRKQRDLMESTGEVKIFTIVR